MPITRRLTHIQRKQHIAKARAQGKHRRAALFEAALLALTGAAVATASLATEQAEGSE